MTETEKQDVIRALNTLAKHKKIYGCDSCAKTAEFALELIKEQDERIYLLEERIGIMGGCE